jgi:carbonic anhydrase
MRSSSGNRLHRVRRKPSGASTLCPATAVPSFIRKREYGVGTMSHAGTSPAIGRSLDSEATSYAGASCARFAVWLSTPDRLLYDCDDMPVVAALEALERLREGNRRFASGTRSIDTLRSQTRLGDLVAGQEPFAVILGCSDSRVPVEIVFDQGLGDLFVIRVAGNIVAPSQIGSVEFAAQRFGTRLVVVLGHTRCGAIQATLEELQQPNTQQSRNLSSIVDRIRPSVEGLLATELRHDREALAQQAILANVRVSANDLRHGSAILERMIQREGLLVVGAEYSLETGVVDFFDGAPVTA